MNAADQLIIPDQRVHQNSDQKTINDDSMRNAVDSDDPIDAQEADGTRLQSTRNSKNK